MVMVDASLSSPRRRSRDAYAACLYPLHLEVGRALFRRRAGGVGALLVGRLTAWLGRLWQVKQLHTASSEDPPTEGKGNDEYRVS